MIYSDWNGGMVDLIEVAAISQLNYGSVTRFVEGTHVKMRTAFTNISLKNGVFVQITLAEYPEDQIENSDFEEDARYSLRRLADEYTRSRDKAK